TIRVSRFKRVENVLGTRVYDVTGKNVVIAQQHAGADPRRTVRNLHATNRSRRLEVATDRSGHVRAMGLNRLRGEPMPVNKYFRSDDLIVCKTRIAKLRLGWIAGVIETRVRNIDSSIDNRDFHSFARVLGTTALIPRIDRGNEPKVRVRHLTLI